MSQPGVRYTLLRELDGQSDSDKRRALLKLVTSALSTQARQPSEEEFAQLDDVLAAAAQDYSLQVRTEFARLVASSVSRFCNAAEQFAMDDIEVAEPVLKWSQALSDAALLRVVDQKTQAHMMAITQRASVSEPVSHALVQRGDDSVVTSLLRNDNARIADHTFEEVSRRAENSPELQAPMARRRDVPLDLLHGLYEKAEKQLRQEILAKFQNVPTQELDKAIERSRSRVTRTYKATLPDLAQARVQLGKLRAEGRFGPPVLVKLQREGQASRTVFKLALAELTGISIDVADRVIEERDIDTIALLCRGARFDRALFVSLAVGLNGKDQGLAGAEAFGQLYESVPVEAAQRALRFWKVQVSAETVH